MCVCVKERRGVSLSALKKALAASGYDVEKNNSRVKLSALWCRPKVSGSFKLNKKQTEVKKPAKKAAPKATKGAAKKKSPKKTKKPVAAAKKATKSPKRAKKPVTPKKSAKSPKKAKKAGDPQGSCQASHDLYASQQHPVKFLQVQLGSRIEDAKTAITALKGIVGDTVRKDHRTLCPTTTSRLGRQSDLVVRLVEGESERLTESSKKRRRRR
ncbi:histone H1-like [Tachysurus ichikawai]